MRAFRWICVFSLTVVAFLSVETFQKPHATAQTKANVADLKKLHYQASEAVTEGGKAIDDPLPMNLKGQFKFADAKSPTTYRELILKSEDVLTKVGIRTKIVVDARPDRCSVTYRPIAGGGTEDFGLTRAERNVDPKTYEFVCNCSESTHPSKIVDCTEDRDVDFDCKR